MENTKICLKCNLQVDDSVRFCPYCGSPEFRQIDPEETILLREEENPYRQRGDSGQSYSYQPTAGIYSVQSKKKGIKWWQILLVVLGSLIAWGIIFGAIETMINRDSLEEDSNNSSGYVDNDTTSVYTTGGINNGWYLNEWANIKFEVTDQWPEGDPLVYSTYSNETTDCGFASADNLAGRAFVICYEDISRSFIKYDADKYMHLICSNMQKQIDSNSMQVEFGDTFNTTIANETYLTVKIYVPVNGVTMYYCVKILDERAIVIFVSSSDESEIKETLEPIRTAK